jgi:hypothetical protein
MGIIDQKCVYKYIVLCDYVIDFRRLIGQIHGGALAPILPGATAAMALCKYKAGFFV